MSVTLLALGLLLLSQPLDVSKVPQEGRAPADFVPAGWTVEDTVRGDLDKNGREDVVLQLIEKPTAGGDAFEERARALLVLLSAEGGKLRRAGASPRVLLCTGCAGTMGGGTGGVAKIQKGVLLLDQVSGSRESMRSLLRFRYEPKEGRFVLIGKDVTVADRLTGQSTLESTNTLTGTKITEKRQYDEKKGKDTLLSSKKEKVAVKRQFLEDVDIENL